MKVDRRLLALSLLVAAAVFAFDLLVPSSVAAAVPYVGLVLMARGSNWPPYALCLTGLATVLAVAGYLIAAGNGTEIALVNRALALGVIWLAGALCYRQAQTMNNLEDARTALKHQADKAVTTAVRATNALGSEREVRERIEQELEETEQRYQSYFNQTFQLAAVLGPSGMVEEANETFLTVGGLPKSEISGKAIWALPIWDQESRDQLRAAVIDAASGNFYRDEIRIEREAGDGMIVDLSIKPVRSLSGEVDLLILEARDITQHKRDQALLMQAQKLEILGQFASGIAHDFNNLLTVIAGNLELMERRAQNNAVFTRRIAKAVNAVFQARGLTDRILTFARKQQLEPRSVNLNILVAEAIDLSKSGLDENTKIDADIAPDLWSCWADPAQLQTAMLNLLINARDAMPNGGRITVRACNLVFRPEHQVNLPDADYVILSVTDEGEGIPAGILEKVTDPFFTTKGPSRGSGLGLSMVHGFTKQSGGDLTISSVEGQGTTISLFLPRSLEKVCPTPQRRETTVLRGEGHVLVVEDEPEVRDATVSMLSDLGYQVEEASNSDEALILLRQGSHFDLLLTDIMMPGDKDGRVLGRLARSILPRLKILYTSADPDRLAEIRATQGDHENVISKPHRYGELAQKAEGLLSREEGTD